MLVSNLPWNVAGLNCLHMRSGSGMCQIYTACIPDGYCPIALDELRHSGQNTSSDEVLVGLQFFEQGMGAASRIFSEIF